MLFIGAISKGQKKNCMSSAMPDSQHCWEEPTLQHYDSQSFAV
jgi:hypothetical protein